MVNTAVLDSAPTLSLGHYQTTETDVVRLYKKAQTLEHRADYRRAIRRYLELQEILSKPEDLAGNLINTGVAYYKNSQFSKAIDCFLNAKEQYPNNYYSDHNRLLTYITMGNFSDARKCAHEIERKDYKDSLMLTGLAIFYDRVEKNAERSFKYSKRAIELGADRASAYQICGYMLSEYKKDYEAAIKIYWKAAAKGFGNMPELLDNFAYALIKAERVDEAKKYLEKINITTLGNRMKAVVNATWGLYYLQKDNTKDANYYYNKAITKADKEFGNLISQKHLYELGEYYLRHKNHKKAKACWLEALKIEVGNEFYDFVDDIERSLSKIGYKYCMKKIENEVVIKRYQKALKFFIFGFVLFLMLFLQWKLTGKLSPNINPFYHFFTCLSFLGLSITCIAGINEHTSIQRKFIRERQS